MECWTLVDKQISRCKDGNGKLEKWNDGPSTSPAFLHKYELIGMIVTGRQAQGDRWKIGKMEH
jgi:hypothetical protein